MAEKEYIKRGDIEKWLLTETASLDGKKDREYVVERLRNEIPAADVMEIRHGKWEVMHGVLTPGGDPWVRCPYCRNKNTEHLEGIEMPEQWNYCPNCGAKMDGGTDK